ncbi:hypothetical protein E2C01_015471 [Portunus trituberculatus]|uniref:Uncharacterized protein n=1 Tax=Portunus trituberculatus TaxID=210409 RepID=A0A5B7DNA2_PORTR|nr:hypothetical protein [Portunus trituberculatus]
METRSEAQRRAEGRKEGSETPSWCWFPQRHRRVLGSTARPLGLVLNPSSEGHCFDKCQTCTNIALASRRIASSHVLTPPWTTASRRVCVYVFSVSPLLSAKSYYVPLASLPAIGSQADQHAASHTHHIPETRPKYCSAHPDDTRGGGGRVLASLTPPAAALCVSC